MRNKELAAVSAGACVGHGQNARLVKSEVACALIFEIFAPDGLAAAASACGVAALDHELLDDAVEDDSVVVAVLTVCGEVFAGLGSDVGEKFECDRTLCGFECDFHSIVVLIEIIGSARGGFIVR